MWLVPPLVELVFAFVHLDEWFHWRMLSRAHYHATQNMGRLIRMIVLKRLNTMVEYELKLDLDVFWNAFLVSKACISGSIFLELLLGPDKFRARDIDIFVVTDKLGKSPSPNWPFLPLHKLLVHKMEEHKGDLDSDADMYFGTDPAHHNRASTNGIFCIYDDHHTAESPLQLSEERIARLHSYELQDSPAHILQIVSLQSKHETADHYIQEGFDFRCCTSTLDGTRLVLHHLSDVFLRKLVLLPQREERILFFTEAMRDQYLDTRLRKYEERGFCLDRPYHFGRYASVLQPEVAKKHYEWSHNQNRDKEEDHFQISFAELKPMCEEFFLYNHNHEMNEIVRSQQHTHDDVDSRLPPKRKRSKSHH